MKNGFACRRFVLKFSKGLDRVYASVVHNSMENPLFITKVLYLLHATINKGQTNVNSQL